MSRSLLIVIAFLLVQHVGCAQNLPPILKADKPTRGIYLTFEEFLNNAPSIQTEFELLRGAKGLSDRVNILILKNTDLWKKVYNFWGVSTGDSVYVNVATYQAGNGYSKILSKGYTTILSMGRYCYTKGFTQSAFLDKAEPGGLRDDDIPMPHQEAYILNINTGNFYMLHRERMTKILANDPELLNSYSAEGQKNKKDEDVMLSYIERYNQRHQDQIGKERLARVILYRREKKERKDTINIVTGDSVQHPMVPGALAAITTTEKIFTLCVKDECKDFSLVFEETNYIECSYKEGGAGIQLIPQEKKVGEYYVREVQVIIDRRKGD